MIEWVQVRVARERYAIDVAQTLEVGVRGDVTSVPGAPFAVVGVHNLRGQVLPVVDLALALGVPGSDGATAAYLVITEAAGQRAALAVDEILAVGVLQGTPEPIEQGGVTGRLMAGGELFGIIDVGRLFASVAGTGGDR